MADVIDFSTKEDMPNNSLDNDNVKLILNELTNSMPSTKDIFAFYKTSDNLINVIETGVTFEDKCVMLQLLQHSINTDLTSGGDAEVTFEPDL